MSSVICYVQLKPKYQYAYISTFPVVIFAFFHHMDGPCFCVFLHPFRILTSCLQHPPPTHTHISHTFVKSSVSVSLLILRHRHFPTACLILSARTSRVPKLHTSRFVCWWRVCVFRHYLMTFTPSFFFYFFFNTNHVCSVSVWHFESRWS